MTMPCSLPRPASLPLLALMALSSFAPAPAAVRFTPLGDLPGGNTDTLAYAISADGTTVVGVSSSANSLSEAFRWTAATGIVGLGDLPGFNFNSRARGVSSNGSVVTGHGTTAPDGFFQGFRWTAGDGLVGIGDIPGGLLASEAYAISANGDVIVGSGRNSANRVEAMRWTSATGAVGLGFFSGGFSSVALGVSGDGNVVVGSATRPFSVTAAFRYSTVDGMQDLGFLPGGTESKAYAANSSGSIVVGYSTIAGGAREAFRWTAATGLVSLGDLPGGGVRSEALAISSDGSVIVGIAEGATIGDGAFIWDATNGMRSIRALLTAAGLAVGWEINAASGVSASGTRIIGYGTDENSMQQSWLLDLDAPDPVAQTITFAALANRTYTGTPLTFTLSATTSSSLPLVYSIIDGAAIATLDSATNVVTISGLGSVTIRAAQPGNDTYAPAVSVDRSFTVSEASVTDPFASFLEAAGVPAGLRGPLDDPDGDGLNNLVEFALGLAPNTASTTGAPEIAVTEGVLSLTYRRAQETGVTYEVETTTDLITWTTIGVTQGTPDTNGRVTATIPLDVPGRFLRLKVSLTPAP